MTTEKNYLLQDNGQTLDDYVKNLPGGWEQYLATLPLPPTYPRNKIASDLLGYININYGGGSASGRPPEFFSLVFSNPQKLAEALLAYRTEIRRLRKEYKTKLTHGKLSRYRFELLVKKVFRHYYPKLNEELVDTDGSPEGVFMSNRGHRIFEKATKVIAEKSGLNVNEVGQELENTMHGEWGRHIEYLMTDFEALDPKQGE